MKMIRTALILGIFQLVQLANALPPSINKFNPELGQQAVIQTELSEAGILDVKIYDRSGTEIRLLINEFRNAGEHPILWDGLDGDAQEAEPGVYQAIIQEEGNTRILNIILVR